MRLFKRGVRTGGSGRESEEGWRKAGRSWANGDCVEVGQLTGGVVAVRDSRRQRGLVLEFDAYQWNVFVGGVRNGEFDRRLGAREGGRYLVVKRESAPVHPSRSNLGAHVRKQPGQ
jgi:hypothetical protein